MRPEVLTVLHFPVGKPALKVTIPYTLEELQRLVGGYIESVGLIAGITLICNEEGRMLDLPPNRMVGRELIVGDFFVTGVSGVEFADLDEDQIRLALELIEGQVLIR